MFRCAFGHLWLFGLIGVFKPCMCWVNLGVQVRVHVAPWLYGQGRAKAESPLCAHLK